MVFNGLILSFLTTYLSTCEKSKKLLDKYEEISRSELILNTFLQSLKIFAFPLVCFLKLRFSSTEDLQ